MTVTDTAGGSGGALQATQGEDAEGEIEEDDGASTKIMHREATGTTGSASAAPTWNKTVDGGATGSTYMPEPSQNAGSGAVDGGGSGD